MLNLLVFYCYLFCYNINIDTTVVGTLIRTLGSSNNAISPQNIENGEKSKYINYTYIICWNLVKVCQLEI